MRYTKQAVFWAQYGGTRDPIAAFKGAVAALKACWMHDSVISCEVVISCSSLKQHASKASRRGKRTTPSTSGQVVPASRFSPVPDLFLRALLLVLLDDVLLDVRGNLLVARELH